MSVDKTILILAANPSDQVRLRLPQEVREIEEGLRLSAERDRFKLVSQWAVRPEDLRRSLLQYKPQFVHFSGHGEGEQGLIFEDESGKTKRISTEALARLFGLCPTVECVLLNACYSEVQARAIGQHIDYVVGMNNAIGDRAAIKFAVGFYDAVGYERSVPEAYEFGLAAIDVEGLDESAVPVLQLRGAGADKDESALPELALEEPEGLVPVGSPFYVERSPIETDCYETVVRPGSLIRIKAPRQMGKTSLLVRTLDCARSQNFKTVRLSFQEADTKTLDDLNEFLQWFCSSVTEELDMEDRLADYWKGARGIVRRCKRYFERYLLTELDQPIVLGLDEVDQVFEHPDIATDFFGMLREWHEEGKSNPLWRKLHLVIVHSKEVYIPLSINRSPFNVGLPIELRQLNDSEITALISKHRLSLTAHQQQQLIELVGGHPYLLRAALYQLARGRISLSQLLTEAPTEGGLYSDHLRRHLLNLEDNESLVTAFQQVIREYRPVQIGSTEAFKLGRVIN